jgi:hypothetical protein
MALGQRSSCSSVGGGLLNSSGDVSGSVSLHNILIAQNTAASAP